jgi:uncharacterized damage-inducible protein DinB
MALFPQEMALGELEQLLSFLRFLRGAILRKSENLTDEQAHWQPDGKLISLIGIINHLTGVERRWIDGALLGGPRDKPADEYHPAGLPLHIAVDRYRTRAAQTDQAALRLADPSTAAPGQNPPTLRFVLLHLINETARHAGHADATRQLLDGTVGE